MRTSFDYVIGLYQSAVENPELIKNHIDDGVHERIKRIIDDINMIIEITDDDDVFLARLHSEKKLLNSALKFYS